MADRIWAKRKLKTSANNIDSCIKHYQTLGVAYKDDYTYISHYLYNLVGIAETLKELTELLDKEL